MNADQLLKQGQKERAPARARDRIWMALADNIELGAIMDLPNDASESPLGDAPADAASPSGASSASAPASTSLAPAAATATKGLLLVKWFIAALALNAVVVTGAVVARSKTARKEPTADLVQGQLHGEQLHGEEARHSSISSERRGSNEFQAPAERALGASVEVGASGVVPDSAEQAQPAADAPSVPNPTRATVAASARRTASPTSDTEMLAQEARLLLEARTALRRGDALQALTRLRTIQSTLPVKQLAPEERELERRAKELLLSEHTDL